MLTKEILSRLLPIIGDWAEAEEKHIHENGIPLSENQIMDAVDAGVRKPDVIRLQKVIRIPIPSNSQLDQAIKLTGLINNGTVALTLGHSIYIRSDFWENRNVLIHEFAHVMQHERLGSIRSFLSHYLNECLDYGFTAAPLEQEAIRVQQEVR
jgi:hypothetical protein